MTKDKINTIQNGSTMPNSKKMRSSNPSNASSDSDKKVSCKKDAMKSIRSRNTRSALSLALIKLLEEEPLEQITVKELTEIAGVNRSTFYLHFKDVRKLFDCVKIEFIDGYYDILKSNVSENMNVMLFMEMITELFRYVQKNVELFKVLVAPAHKEDFIESIEKGAYITKAIMDKNLDDEEKEYLITFMANSSIAVICKWVREGMKNTPEEMTGILVKMIFTDKTQLRVREK